MLEIRPAEAQDAPEMARVIVDTWFAAHEGQVSAERYEQRRASWGYAESAEAWQRAFAEANRLTQLLVAISEGQLVAVLAAEASSDEEAEVGALYVDVPHQGSGVGRRLLETVMDNYRRHGVRRLVIAVLATNHPARRFYERMGGVSAGTREDPDGLEMLYTWDLDRAETERRER